ncbi:MAG: AAA family ATPase [bacterium]|nr:AAA family ATPase [bacterium]
MTANRQPSNLIRYLRDCYQADNREQSILNIFGQTVQFRYFMTEPDEILSGTLDQVPVEDEDLLEVQATASMHRTEKELLFGTIFVAGYVREGEAIRRICAPLIYYPAEVVEGLATPFLEIDFDGQRINFPLLSQLASFFDLDAVTLESVVDQIPSAPLDIGKIGYIVDLFDEFFPEIATQDLLLFPAQCEEKKLRQIQRATKNSDVKMRLKCLFGSAIILVQKSVDTRGALAELSTLAEEKELSKPLRILLAQDKPSDVKGAPFEDRVPAVLSPPQKRVLQNAATHPMSLAIGPPGTGKSFIIAAVALDALRRGESVLVASKMNHAVDVVADKIESILGIKSFVVRGGRKQYLKDLKASIDQILNGVLPIPDLPPDEEKRLQGELREADVRLRQLEKALSRRSRDEQIWGRSVVEGPGKTNVLARWIAQLKARVLGPRLQRDPTYWELMNEYQGLLERHIRLSAQLIQAGIRRRIEQVQDRSRETLTRFSQAVRARTAARKENFFGEIDLQALFQAFPVWMVNLADVSTVVPMRHELFDVVIIDEATQCDVASCLPVIQRAKRVVVTGDPGQLRHLSFLSRKRQERAARRAEVESADAALYDYRDKSVLDIVNELIHSQQQVTFLDEHFRSLPPIIAFSNREFYSDRLKIMQERPVAEASDCQEYRLVEGRRDDSGVNLKEAKALVKEVAALIDRERKQPPTMRHTLGILSPFKAQVELVTTLLGKATTLTRLREHEVLIGTPYAFQGEERDVMFLSLVLDSESHSAAFGFLNRADVFNVSVTRARSRQVVFGSVTSDGENVSGLLQRYLEHLDAEHQPAEAARGAASDPFLEELREALKAAGFKTWVAYPIAGFKVDLVVERGGQSLGIDLVGYPGEYCGAFELERYRLFNRAGLRLFPLPYSTWCFDRKRCLAAIESAIQEPESANG